MFLIYYFTSQLKITFVSFILLLALLAIFFVFFFCCLMNILLFPCELTIIKGLKFFVLLCPCVRLVSSYTQNYCAQQEAREQDITALVQQ